MGETRHQGGHEKSSSHHDHGHSSGHGHGHGDHGHSEERPVELHGKWKPYEETVPSSLKIAFLVLFTILVTICYMLMRNKKGHGHH